MLCNDPYIPCGAALGMQIGQWFNKQKKKTQPLLQINIINDLWCHTAHYTHIINDLWCHTAHYTHILTCSMASASDVGHM